MKRQSKLEKPATWEPESVFTVKVIVYKAYSSKSETDPESGQLTCLQELLTEVVNLIHSNNEKELQESLNWTHLTGDS